MPPPTGISPAGPSATSVTLGSCLGVLRGCGAEEEAGGAIAVADGAGPPPGGTPASLASYGTAAVLQPASVAPRPTAPSSTTPRLVGRGSSRGSTLTTLRSSSGV